MQTTKKFVTINPFWDTIEPLIHSKKAISLYQAECDKKFCARYAFAIADPASVAFVAEYLHPQAIEIGAGNGYWAWQLSQCGIDILAYDIAPVDQTWANSYFSPLDKETREHLGILTQTWYPVQQGGPKMVSEHPERTLFLCWPVRGMHMASQCLQYYQGKRLVYIGEYRTGTTGDDLFFDMLENEWQAIARHDIVQWDGAHDDITVYERGTTGAMRCAEDCCNASPDPNERNGIITYNTGNALPERGNEIIPYNSGNDSLGGRNGIEPLQFRQ